MNLAEKNEAIESISGSFSKAAATFVVDFKGCKCSELTKLRGDLRATGSKLTVVKNSLTKRAIQDMPYADLSKKLEGPTAVIWTGDDPITPAKIVTKFAKDVEAFKVKGGVFEGRVVELKEIEQMALLPSKEELYSKLLALLNTPAMKLVQLLDAPGTQLVRLLSAWQSELEKKGDSQ